MAVSIHTRHYWRVKRAACTPRFRRRNVSIHTRHYWRAKLFGGKVRTGSSGFNPHPPLLAGETDQLAAVLAARLVSIHTRHYWRVKQSQVEKTKKPACFNPHPPLLAGETQQCVILCNPQALFQSTPAITGG